VEIDVVEHPAERFDPACLKLYRPESVSDELPWMTTARLSYRRENGRNTLSVVSQAPLLDPVVHLGVRSECAGGTSRQYTLDLSAAAWQAPAAGQRAGSAPAVLTDSASALPLAAAPRGLPSSPAPASVSGDEGVPLRLSDELSAPARSSELGRELFRLQHRTLQMLNDPNDQQQALSEKLAWLEANVAELKRAGDRLEGTAAAIPAAPAAPAAPEAKAGREPALATPLPAAPVSPGAAGSLPPASGEMAKASGSAAAQPSRRPPPAGVPDAEPWALYAGLVAAVFLVALLFRRRESLETARPSKPSAAAGQARREPVVSRLPEEVRAVPIAVAAKVATVTVAAAPAPSPQPAVPPPPPQPAVPPPAYSPEPEANGAGPALELAEIMLSFGRVSGAAKTLEEYLAALPQESVRPWIRLLQIYQRNGMRDEFEALTLKLNRNFNVEIMRWEGGDSRKELQLLPLDTQQGKAMTLEEIPRIRYLEKLLRDNRDGQRSGFTLTVVEEILFLIDIVATREAAQQFSQNP
jgi:pilus assembly protein FimV